MSKNYEQIETLILNTLADRDRISVTDLANNLDSTADEIEIPLARLKEQDKIVTVAGGVVLKLSAKERHDFKRLDKRFQTGQRESVAALREIRDRKLFREEYTTFDDYMSTRGRTRQWATQQISWLRRIELLEEYGKDSYQGQLTVDDMQVLGPLEDDPNTFVAAVIEGVEEAERRGKKQKKPFLKEAVARQQRFLQRRKDLAVPDLTYDESKLLDRLGNAEESSINLTEEAQMQAKESNKDFYDCLIMACDQRRAIPSEFHLLSAVRGDDLRPLVEQLEVLITKWAEENALKKEEHEYKQKLASVQRKLGREPEEDEDSEEIEDDEKNTSDASDDEDANNEEDTGTQSRYKVQITGTFNEWVRKQFGMEGEGDALLDHASLVGVFAYLLDTLKKDGSLASESTIRVRPLADERPNSEEEANYDDQKPEA